MDALAERLDIDMWRLTPEVSRNPLDAFTDAIARNWLAHIHRRALELSIDTFPDTVADEYLWKEMPGVYEEGERIIIEPIPSLDELHGIHAGDHEPGEVLERVRELKAEEMHRDEERAERLRPSQDHVADEGEDGDGNE